MEYWKKNLLFIWLSQFFAMVGMSSIVPFLPLFIRELGIVSVSETAKWSGWVFAGPFFISFFLTPVWGSLGDKYGRKIISIRAIFGLAIAQVLVGLSQNVTHLFLARLLQGALSGFIPSAMALVAANTPKEKTSYALGILQTGTAAGTVLGPLIGGFLADLMGYRNVFFLVSGLLTLTGVFFIIFVKEQNKVDKNDKKYSWIENWKFIFASKKLLKIALLIALTSLGFTLIRPIFVLYLETFNITSEYFATITGAVYGVMGIFTAFSSAIWGKRAVKSGYKRNLIYAASITAAMYFVHFFIYDVWLLIIVRSILGFGFGGLLPLLFSYLNENVPFNRKSGVLAVGSSFQILGNIAGPTSGGMISSMFGLRIPFLLSGFIFIIFSSIVLSLKGKNKISD